MFVICQRVDRRHTGKLCELFDVALRVSSDYRAVRHSRQHPRGVFDQLAPPQLGIRSRHVNRFPAELADSDFKGNSRSC